MLRELTAKKIPVDLTLVVNEIVYNSDDLERAYPSEFRRYEDPQTLASALTQLQQATSGWSADDFARARAVMPKVLQLARRLYEAGVAMYIGTDGHGGSWYYARELQLHVQAGIPPWAVLAMATSQSADILGLGKRTGRIAPGYQADVTFLNGDPVADMAQAGKVYGVLTKGQFYLSSELLQEVSQGPAP